MTPDADRRVAEIRKASWETRRKKYGSHGHSGSYSCRYAKDNVRGMVDLIIRLHREGVLSEGQVAKATGMDRIAIRRLADNQPVETCR